MKIPKRIEKLIEQRAKVAEKFNHYDYELSIWLDKNNVETEDYDTHGGVESIVNPWASADRIKEAIENTD